MICHWDTIKISRKWEKQQNPVSHGALCYCFTLTMVVYYKCALMSDVESGDRMTSKLTQETHLSFAALQWKRGQWLLFFVLVLYKRSQSQQTQTSQPPFYAVSPHYLAEHSNAFAMRGITICMLTFWLVYLLLNVIFKPYNWYYNTAII